MMQLSALCYSKADKDKSVLSKPELLGWRHGLVGKTFTLKVWGPEFRFPEHIKPGMVERVWSQHSHRKMGGRDKSLKVCRLSEPKTLSQTWWKGRPALSSSSDQHRCTVSYVHPHSYMTMCTYMRDTERFKSYRAYLKFQLRISWNSAKRRNTCYWDWNFCLFFRNSINS